MLGRQVKPDWLLTCVSSSAHCVGALLGTRRSAPTTKPGVRHTELKRIQHPDVGVLELHFQVLFDIEQSRPCSCSRHPGHRKLRKAPAALADRRPATHHLTSALPREASDRTAR